MKLLSYDGQIITIDGKGFEVPEGGGGGKLSGVAKAIVDPDEDNNIGGGPVSFTMLFDWDAFNSRPSTVNGITFGGGEYHELDGLPGTTTQVNVLGTDENGNGIAVVTLTPNNPDPEDFDCFYWFSLISRNGEKVNNTSFGEDNGMYLYVDD